MKTSYFGNRKLGPGHYLVRISAYPCRFKKSDAFAGLLAPPRQLLADLKAGEIEMDEYEKRFRKHLYSVGVPAIRQQLAEAIAPAGNREPVLMCFCGPGQSCHRRMFATWWQEQGEKLIPEL